MLIQSEIKKLLTAYNDANPNSGLPAGAIKCKHEKANRLLKIIWKREIEIYKNSGWCLSTAILDCGTIMKIAQQLDLKISQSGTNNEFNKQVNPIVEGKNWYRGITVQNGERKIFILQGWIDISGVDNWNPTIYTNQDMPEKIIFNLVKKYYIFRIKILKLLRKL